MVTSLELRIDGMSCGRCVARVRKTLERVPGVRVESVGVGSARVWHDPSAVPEATVVSAVAEAGYDARKEESDVPESCCAGGAACAPERR